MQQDTPPAAPPVAGLAALLSAGGAPAPSLLADRPDGTVVRVGDAVAKAHAPGTDTAALAVRLRLAADPVFDGVLLPPLRLAPAVGLCAGRPVTAWPYGAPVDPSDPGAVPWEEAGALLARLHAASLPELARRHGPGGSHRGRRRGRTCGCGSTSLHGTLAVQTAATAVAKAAGQRRTLDEDEEALLGACSRIVELPGHVRP